MHAVLLLLVIWRFILSVILVVLGITGRTRLVVSLGVGTVLSDVVIRATTSAMDTSVAVYRSVVMAAAPITAKI